MPEAHSAPRIPRVTLESNPSLRQGDRAQLAALAGCRFGIRASTFFCNRRIIQITRHAGPEGGHTGQTSHYFGSGNLNPPLHHRLFA